MAMIGRMSRMLPLFAVVAIVVAEESAETYYDSN